VKIFDADKTRMIGLGYVPYGEKNYDDMLSRFHLIPEHHGQTDRRAISISRISVLISDKTHIILYSKAAYLLQMPFLNCELHLATTMKMKLHTYTMRLAKVM